MSGGHQFVKVAEKLAKPILSSNRGEARRRVLNLYKAWYRQIPFIVTEFDINKSEKQCKEKLREKFYQNKHVTDIRVIDTLVIKGQLDLKETVQIFKQAMHIMMFWKDTVEKKPTDFLSKFFTNQP